ncbi:MAG TPA: ParB/RepB/Spo0J family partition protein [Solirubrobacteraceae bacterium]|nr:ParB/RepB/Spo0J family partition protein [Solirubrobacteraceae bacterium]
MTSRCASNDGERDAKIAAQLLRELPLQLIDPNPSQPRQRFEQEALHALAGSIRERGVLQPVLVRPRPGGRYQIVAGERRWFAAQIAGLETIPALLCPYDDAATLEVALIENMARENLNAVEQARACQTLVELGLTHQQIGERVGLSASAVANLRRLLNLSEEILQLIERDELGVAHGRALLVAKDAGVREELAAKAVKERWRVLRLEARARESNSQAASPDEKPQAQREPPNEATEEQYLDEASLAAATAWGDLVGIEVRVRPMARGRVRLEVQFNSPQAAIEAAARLAEAVSGSKGPDG